MTNQTTRRKKETILKVFVGFPIIYIFNRSSFSFIILFILSQTQSGLRLKIGIVRKQHQWYKILIWSRFTHLTNTYTHLSVYLNKNRFNLTYLYLVPITTNFLTTYLIYEILVFNRLRKHTSNKDRKGSNCIGYDYRLLRMSVTL